MVNKTEFTQVGEIEYYITLTVFSILTALGLFVNAYIVCIYVFINKVRTMFCRFLLHLSLINIGQYIGIIPYLVVDLHRVPFYSKYLESFVCSVCDGHSSMLVFSMASVLLLTAMSILRCESMISPFRRLINELNLNKIFFFTWFFGCISFIPYMLSYKLNHKVGICYRSWIISESFGFAYMTIIYISGMLIPLSVMIVACITSYFKLRTKQFNCKSLPSIRQQVLFRLITLVVVFCATWFPYSIYWLMTFTIYARNDNEKQFKRVKLLRYVLIPSLIGGVVGPVLNVLYWQPFQSHIKSILCFRSSKTPLPPKKELSFNSENTKLKSEVVNVSESVN